MNKFSSFLAGVLLMVLSFNAQAQTKPADYFSGKWNVEVKGTPQGDSKMVVTLERKDGKLTGYLTAKEMADTSKFTKVEETGKSVTVYFISQGYDVFLKLDKKDDDNVTGSMMDMFDATGVRIQDSASKKS